MKLWSCGLVAALAVGLIPAAGTGQEGGNSPGLLLHVVRLRPGDSKRVELGLPYEAMSPIRPSGKSGRDSLFVNLVLDARSSSTAKGKPVENDGKGVFRLPAGVELVWVENRPEIEFRAAPSAKAAATNLRGLYHSFAGGDFVIGFRVVVEVADMVEKIADKDVQTVLEKADQIELPSLDPRARDEGKDGFYGHQVLGKTALKDAEARKKILTALANGIKEKKGESVKSAAFYPRYGIRAT